MRNSYQITPSSTIDYTVPMPSGNYAQVIEGKCRAQSIITLLQKRINYFKKYENHISNRIEERVNRLSKVILVQQNAQKERAEHGHYRSISVSECKSVGDRKKQINLSHLNKKKTTLNSEKELISNYTVDIIKANDKIKDLQEIMKNHIDKILSMKKTEKKTIGMIKSKILKQIIRIPDTRDQTIQDDSMPEKKIREARSPIRSKLESIYNIQSIIKRKKRCVTNHLLNYSIS